MAKTHPFGCQADIESRKNKLSYEDVVAEQWLRQIYSQSTCSLVCALSAQQGGGGVTITTGDAHLKRETEDS